MYVDRRYSESIIDWSEIANLIEESNNQWTVGSKTKAGAFF